MSTPDGTLTPEWCAWVQRMAEIHAFTVIDYRLTEAEEANEPDAPKQLFAKMREALGKNKVDEVRLVCYEALGNEEQVQVLREWLKKPKYQPSPETLRELGLE